MATEQQVRQQVFRRANRLCECTLTTCGHPRVRGGTRCTRRPTQLHRVDRSRPHSISNCLALCRPCHEFTGSYGQPL